MNILISNDDGFDSPGLKALVKHLEKENNVYVLAPDSNRSAVSHHIKMFNDTGISKINDKFYTCSGFPADCVAIGLQSDLFDIKFDVVISGINMGGNLGTDIVYSGTCAAARQAIFDGVPGIAVSCEPESWDAIKEKGFKFDGIAAFVAKNLKALVEMTSVSSPRRFVNINALPIDEYKGVKVSSELCVRKYGDKLKILEKEGQLVSQFEPGFVPPLDEYTENCDYKITHNEYICVSVVYAEPLCDSADESKLVL